MQYVVPTPGITACGAGIAVTLDGCGVFKMLASQYLHEAGIGEFGPDGMLKIGYDQWYSCQAYLDAWKRISGEVSEQIMEEAGRAVPDRAQFPPTVKDIESALSSIDVAYHMNHKRNGQLMFDMATGQMTEGIGHYVYSKTPGKNEITMVCDNPYPCALDRGLISAMARRFQPHAQVIHDPKKPCRNRGADTCTFVITW